MRQQTFQLEFRNGMGPAVILQIPGQLVNALMRAALPEVRAAQEDGTNAAGPSGSGAAAAQECAAAAAAAPPAEQEPEETAPWCAQ